MTITRVFSSGDPRTLGRAQGEATGEAIRDALDFYAGLAARRATSIEELAAPLESFIAPARRALPHLVAEREGLAEGAEIAISGE